jgi:hypothetical protein
MTKNTDIDLKYILPPSLQAPRPAPSEPQYRLLLQIADGTPITALRAGVERLGRFDWVEPCDLIDGRGVQMVRISSAGLRAVADGVERYGLPPVRRQASAASDGLEVSAGRGSRRDPEASSRGGGALPPSDRPATTRPASTDKQHPRHG